MKDDTPTKPTAVLPKSDNGFRTVKTNSVEHDRLLTLGYVEIEADDVNTILHEDRRHEAREPQKVDVESQQARRILDQLAAQLTAAGQYVEGNQLQWVVEQFHTRIQQGERAVCAGSCVEGIVPSERSRQVSNWAGKTPTKDEWRDILEKHAKWLTS